MIIFLLECSIFNMWFCYCWTTFNHVQPLYKSKYVSWYLEQIEHLPSSQKDDKQIISNSRPVSLLPICGEIFERLMFSSFYEYVEENKLLSTMHQFGFRSNDSCVNQLLWIVHNLWKDFDAHSTLETRGVLVDMGKAFEKVWHQRLIFKLKPVGFSDSLSNLIESFLSNRFQRVLLNGQTSKWLPVKAGVSQRFHPWSNFFPNLH